MRMTRPLHLLLAFLCAALLFSGGFAAGRKARGDGALLTREMKDSLFQERRGEGSSEKARLAARYLMEYLTRGGAGNVRRALDIYTAIVPAEEVGSELASLRWFCSYFAGSPQQRAELLRDRDAVRMLRELSRDRFAPLKSWLALQYGLGPEGVRGAERNRRVLHLAEFLWWNGPTRKQWEKTDALVAAIGVRRGADVADIGCGYGYHTFRLSEAVGEEGCVFAIDIIEEHLTWLAKAAKEEGLHNIRPILSRTDDLTLKEGTLDCAFMCSTYHTIYAFSPDGERETFFASVRRALRARGTLVIADNSPAAGGEKLFAGRRIAKSLVAGQLGHCGFRLVKDCQVSPQRYVLVFRKAP